MFLTVFVTGDRNVVDSSEFETGAGQDLELDRTQHTRLEIWKTHSNHTVKLSLSCGAVCKKWF